MFSTLSLRGPRRCGDIRVGNGEEKKIKTRGEAARPDDCQRKGRKGDFSFQIQSPSFWKKSEDLAALGPSPHGNNARVLHSTSALPSTLCTQATSLPPHHESSPAGPWGRWCLRTWVLMPQRTKVVLYRVGLGTKQVWGLREREKL